MKQVIFVFGFLITSLIAYSQGGVASVGGATIDTTTEIETRAHAAATYKQKGDSINVDGYATKHDIDTLQENIDGLGGAGATALDDIGDPDAATTIGLDDGETITINSAEDAGTVLTINMTDADAGGNIFGIDLIHAGDANSAYQFMRCYDNTNDLQFSISSNGNVLSAGTITSTSWMRCDYGDIMSRKINDTPATTSSFTLQKARDGTPTSNVSDEDYLGEINFKGYHTGSYLTGALIRGVVNDTPGDDDMPSRLELFVSENGSYIPTKGLIIDTAGIGFGDAHVEEAELEILDGATVTTTELNYVSGVTSTIQTQINTKLTSDADSVVMTANGAVTWDDNDTIPPVFGSGDLIDVGDVAVLLDDNDSRLEAFQLMGSTIKAFAIGVDITEKYLDYSLVDNDVFVIAFHIRATTTITGVGFTLSQQGDYTADNYNGAALFKFNAGNIDSVTCTANDGNFWKAAAGGMVSEAFADTYEAAAGIYYVGFFYNNSAQVTVPKIAAGLTWTSNAGSLFTNDQELFGNDSGYNTVPSSIALSDINGNSNRVIAWLY